MLNRTTITRFIDEFCSLPPDDHDALLSAAPHVGHFIGMLYVIRCTLYVIRHAVYVIRHTLYVIRHTVYPGTIGNFQAATVSDFSKAYFSLDHCTGSNFIS